MNELIASTDSQQITMTSLELVDFINEQRKEDRLIDGGAERPVLRHDHFLDKVIEVIGEKDAPKFRGIYRDSMNREKPCYRFPKREACLLAMSYSYSLQAKVYDRMTALETRPVAALPSYPEALRQLASSIELNTLQQALIDVQKPAVEALERIAQSPHENNMRDAAKCLQIKPGTMTGWLASLRWISRGNGRHWFALQPAIDSGYMITRQNEQELEDGSVKIRPQAMVTQRGIEKLARMLSKDPTCNLVF